MSGPLRHLTTRCVHAGETPDPQQTKALGCTMKMYDD